MELKSIVWGAKSDFLFAKKKRLEMITRGWWSVIMWWSKRVFWVFFFGIYMASIGGMCDVYILYYGYEGVNKGLTYPLMATRTFKDHSSTLDYSYPWDFSPWDTFRSVGFWTVGGIGRFEAVLGAEPSLTSSGIRLTFGRRTSANDLTTSDWEYKSIWWINRYQEDA